ncbi:MAG: hypothetical protein RMI83_02700 [Desulfurococcaceae archaeon]|nr:hypothetical protein [Sulfolobales archaeon]MDW8169995.1 hypothetical protein [Desulfurococcaceae archaeon]
MLNKLLVGIPVYIYCSTESNCQDICIEAYFWSKLSKVHKLLLLKPCMNLNDSMDLREVIRLEPQSSHREVLNEFREIVSEIIDKAVVECLEYSYTLGLNRLRNLLLVPISRRAAEVEGELRSYLTAYNLVKLIIPNAVKCYLSNYIFKGTKYLVRVIESTPPYIYLVNGEIDAVYQALHSISAEYRNSIMLLIEDLKLKYQ